MTKPEKRRRRHPFLFIFLLLILTAAFLLIDSNVRLVTAEYELNYKNLPESFDGFRIVTLSDIHAAEYGEGNETLLKRVREASPDIIAVTGDLIDRDDQLHIIDPLITGLIDIAPVYYITGNHEWDSGGLHDLLSLLDDRGVTILRNKYVTLERGGESIILAGTDDPNGPADMIRPDAFVERIYDNEGSPFIVLLEHRNNNLPLYAPLGVDLILCGHAHGGMIRLPFTDGLIGPRREWFPTYTDGVYTLGSTMMLVSRGIGNHTGVPRFLNNPHVVVAVLKKG